MSNVHLYDVTDVDSIPWQETPEGHLARGFLEPMIRHGVHHFIDNVKTKMMVLVVDGIIMPLTVNDGEYGNSFVCSPYGHYILYGLQHVSTMDNIFLRNSLSLLLKTVGAVLKNGNINKVVIVNNWLFATDLYPTLSEEQVTAIRDYLLKRFPEHAILFRSIHTFKDNTLYQALQKNHFDFIASRQIFLIGPNDSAAFTARAFKSDLKLMHESNYEEVPETRLINGDADRIKDLYAQIYQGKHSDLNPQFNCRFVNLMIDNKFPHLIALRKEGKIDAVAGYICLNGVMVCPFLGYDTTVESAKLYRLTCTALTLEAKKRGMLFNLSAGASFYKTIRKAAGILERFAVYDRHLPIKRRLPWNLLRWMANTIGLPFIRNYDK